MKARTAVFAILAFSAVTFSAVVLNETFETDNGNWNPLLGSTYSITGGQLSVPCTTSTGIKWVVAISPVIGNFTMTVEAAFQSPDSNARVGFTYRTQDNLDSYHFYVYPSGEYILYKYVSGLWTDFTNHFRVGHSFIRADRNLLKLVCDGNTMTFLCNGQKLTSITDASLGATGRIGLVASGKVTGLFDNLVVDDAPAADNGLTVFADDFSATALTGWRNYANRGTFQVESGKLRCASENSSNFTLLQSDGDYGSADTISVFTEKGAPVPTGTYLFGLMFHYATFQAGSSSLSSRSYIFCIVNGTHHLLLKQEGSTITQLYAPQPSLSIQSVNNTLKVVCGANGAKDLYINATKVYTVTDTAYASGGVGLVANGNVIVNFDNFRVAAGSPVAAELTPVLVPGAFALSASPNPFYGAARIALRAPGQALARLEIFDLAGRSVFKKPVRGSLNLRWNAAALPSGVYTLRLTSAGRSLSRTLLLIR